MPSKIEYLNPPGIIKVTSYGKADIEDWKNALIQVVTLGKENGVSSVLVDSRRQETLPNTVDLYNFAVSLPREFKFAVVSSEALEDEHYFLQTTAKNRGQPIQIFRDYKEALKWLE